MDAALAAIVAAPEPAAPAGALSLLLADFLGCVRASAEMPPGSFADDGVAGVVALLALRSSAQDRDDIDWRSLHHPGSVIWPVVVALAAAHDLPGDLAERAAARGYLTAATAADLLGSSHRAAWHVTATAGALGAAAAASVLLGAGAHEQERALSLAAANAGGLARAARERRGAAGFNRAAAATLGLASARAGVAGAAVLDAAFDGPGGMRETMSGPTEPGDVRVRDGLADAAPRFLAVSGFLQGAVVGAARARAALAGDLVSLRIGLTAGAVPLVDGSDAGPWWDARTSALRAWAAASPSAVERAGPLDGRTDLASVEVSDVPVGHARVRAATDVGEVDLLVAPTTLADPDAPSALTVKWTGILGGPGKDLAARAREALTSSGRPGRLVDWLAS